MKTRIVCMLPLVVALLALPPAAAAAAAPRPADTDIAAWVERALREDPRVDSADLRITAEDGVVTVAGTVWNLAERDYALLEAKKIRGVRAVIDAVEVVPLARDDATIHADIRRRLAADPAVPADRIDVKVRNGVAVLTGTVGSWTEKQEAGTVAGEVIGLKDLRNELSTVWEHGRSDREIERDVAATLSRDVYLTDLPVVATVKDGVVHLTGEVGTPYQKVRADELAWVDNVQEVRNDLVVRPWLDEGVRKAMPTPSDQDLEAAVEASLRRDLHIEDPFRITVLAHEGSVTLRGTVRTRGEWLRADRDARNVVGVGWVTNLVMVNPGRRADGAIREDVSFNLATDWALAGQEVAVRVDRGVVTLTGTVTTTFEKAHAADVAGRVEGVRRVVNDLGVAPGEVYTDTSIKDRIESRLHADWLTSWREPDITVDVHEGRVVLTGKVDTWAERAEAGRVAYGTAGVWRVDNELAVAETDYPWATAGTTGLHPGRDGSLDLDSFYLFDWPL